MGGLVHITGPAVSSWNNSFVESKSTASNEMIFMFDDAPAPDASRSASGMVLTVNVGTGLSLFN